MNKRREHLWLSMGSISWMLNVDWIEEEGFLMRSPVGIYKCIHFQNNMNDIGNLHDVRRVVGKDRTWGRINNCKERERGE